jgi:hypothetical protein
LRFDVAMRGPEIEATASSVKPERERLRRFSSPVVMKIPLVIGPIRSTSEFVLRRKSRRVDAARRVTSLRNGKRLG